MCPAPPPVHFPHAATGAPIERRHTQHGALPRACILSGHGCALPTPAINYLYSNTNFCSVCKKLQCNRVHATTAVVYIHIVCLPLTSIIPICFYLGLDWQESTEVRRQLEYVALSEVKKFQPTETKVTKNSAVVPCIGTCPRSGTCHREVRYLN